jgi:peptide chain release factor
MTWLVVTSGRGPEECHIAVARVVEILLAEARRIGVAAELIDAEKSRHGLVSALVALKGETVDAFARSWAGTVRWTCASPLRPDWSRKNWFLGISLLSPPAPSGAFKAADIRFEACRASGPGGQHVNKTSSAVRATHLPTGLSVFAQEERSQHRNKALAVARIAAALAERDRRGGAAAKRDRWSRHDALERGNAVRVFEGPDFVESGGAGCGPFTSNGRVKKLAGPEIPQWGGRPWPPAG